jgi:chromosome segregation ATPase
MKRTMFFLMLLAFALPSFAQTPETAIERMAAMMQSISNLKSTNEQIATFSADLDAAKINQSNVAARQTALIATGEALQKDFKTIDTDLKANNAEIVQQRAQCPDQTTNPTLYAQCKAWAKKLDDSHKEILGRLIGWTGRKNVLFAGMQQWDKDTGAAEKLVNYLQFSLSNLERSKERILKELGKINQEVLDCRAAIANASEEEMAERCGQLFDGNALHPALINQGTGSNTFGTGGNPTNESGPHN